MNAEDMKSVMLAWQRECVSAETFGELLAVIRVYSQFNNDPAFASGLARAAIVAWMANNKKQFFVVQFVTHIPDEYRDFVVRLGDKDRITVSGLVDKKYPEPPTDLKQLLANSGSKR